MLPCLTVSLFVCIFCLLSHFHRFLQILLNQTTFSSLITDHTTFAIYGDITEYDVSADLCKVVGKIRSFGPVSSVAFVNFVKGLPLCLSLNLAGNLAVFGRFWTARFWRLSGTALWFFEPFLLSLTLGKAHDTFRYLSTLL